MTLKKKATRRRRGEGKWRIKISFFCKTCIQGLFSFPVSSHKIRYSLFIDKSTHEIGAHHLKYKGNVW